jgi:hypothetical protein
MIDGPRFYRLKPDHSVEPVADAVEWGKAWEAERRVDLTELAPGISVSTVFLGIDHNWSGKGRPVLFETMTFDDYGGGDCWRWSTWDEAIAGHARAVAELTKKLVSRWAAEAKPRP